MLFDLLRSRFSVSFPKIKIIYLNENKRRKNFWISKERENAIKNRLSKKEKAMAEKMTQEASNCFLKTLEETSPDTIIILITSSISRILTNVADDRSCYPSRARRL